MWIVKLLFIDRIYPACVQMSPNFLPHCVRGYSILMMVTFRECRHNLHVVVIFWYGNLSASDLVLINVVLGDCHKFF